MTNKPLSNQERARIAQNPEGWGEVSDEQFLEVAFNRYMAYGQFTRMNPPEDALWDEFWASTKDIHAELIRRVPAPDRKRFAQRISDAAGEEFPDALSAFLYVEEDSDVAAQAALDFAMTCTYVGDALVGPRHLRAVADDAETTPAARAGIFRGLLLLGDRRVLPLLDRCWESLDARHRKRLTHAAPVPLFASMYEFYMDWFLLEEDEDVQGAVASAIARAYVHHQLVPGGVIRDIERSYPASSSADGDPVRVVAEWSLFDFARHIEPRLRELEAAEGGTEKVMPLLIKAIGLG